MQNAAGPKDEEKEDEEEQRKRDLDGLIRMGVMPEDAELAISALHAQRAGPARVPGAAPDQRVREQRAMAAGGTNQRARLLRHQQGATTS